MINLFAENTVADLRRAAVAAAWGLGVLAVGTLVIGMAGLLVEVAERTRFGLIGAAVVALAAIGVAAATFFRKPSASPKGPGRRPKPPQDEPDPPRPVVGPVVTVLREEYHIKPPTLLAPPERPLEDLDPLIPEQLAELKNRYAAAMLAPDLDLAERVVARIESSERFADLCQTYRKAVDVERRKRAELGRDQGP